MKQKFALMTALVAVGLALPGAAGAGGQIDSGPALRVGIATVDGKKKVKVRKKLPILASCNRACSAVVKASLITPLSTFKDSAAGNLEDNGFVRTGLKLTRRGLNYLRKNFRKSRYKVKIVAVDLETGKRAVKTKVFRFRK